MDGINLAQECWINLAVRELFNEMLASISKREGRLALQSLLAGDPGDLVRLQKSQSVSLPGWLLR